MIANRKLTVADQSLWVSFKKENPRYLLTKCMQELKPLLKGVTLNNDLLAESFKGAHPAGNFSRSLGKSLDRIQHLIFQASTLSKLYTGNLLVSMTEESPELIIGEINDMRAERYKLVNSSTERVNFTADHSLLIMVLNAWLDQTARPGQSYEVRAQRGVKGVSLIIDMGHPYGKAWQRSIASTFVFEVLSAMNAALLLHDTAMEIILKPAEL